MKTNPRSSVILIFNALLTITAALLPFTASAADADPAEQAARNCLQAIGPTWDPATYKTYAVPEAFSNEEQRQLLAKLLTAMNARFGPLVKIKKVKLAEQDNTSRTYYLFTECKNSPMRAVMQMVPVGHDWKVRNFNVDAEDDSPPASAEQIERMQKYADTVVSSMVLDWDYKKLWDERDPAYFNSEDQVRSYFQQAAENIGTVSKPGTCQLLQSGSLTPDTSFAKFSCAISGKKAVGSLLLTVSYPKGKPCRIAALLVGAEGARGTAEKK